MRAEGGKGAGIKSQSLEVRGPGGSYVTPATNLSHPSWKINHIFVCLFLYPCFLQYLVLRSGIQSWKTRFSALLCHFLRLWRGLTHSFLTFLPPDTVVKSKERLDHFVHHLMKTFHRNVFETINSVSAVYSVLIWEFFWMQRYFENT